MLLLLFIFFEIFSRMWNHNLRTNWDCIASLKCRTPCRKKQTWLPTRTPPRKTRPKTTWVIGKKPISPKTPHAILGTGKMKNEREIVKEKEETAGSQPCKRKRLTEVLKAPTPSPAKTDSCNPFHKRKQYRTKDR